MQGGYKLSDEQSPLASNDLLCLHLRFDDVWFRALYKCDHLVTFSLRGLAARRIVRGKRKMAQEASGSLVLRREGSGRASGLSAWRRVGLRWATTPSTSHSSSALPPLVPSTRSQAETNTSRAASGSRQILATFDASQGGVLLEGTEGRRKRMNGCRVDALHLGTGKGVRNHCLPQHSFKRGVVAVIVEQRPARLST
jgi:hypothetical protein